MILSTIPATVGESKDTSPRTTTVEIGKDIMKPTTYMFLPFVKYQYTYYAQSSRSLFHYPDTLLTQYGIDSSGKLLSIGLLNMYGGQVFPASIGTQFIPGTQQVLNLRIRMGLSSIPYLHSSYYSSHYNVLGPMTVYYRPGWSTVQGTHMNWMDFVLDTPFDYDGDSSLVIEFEWDAISGYSVGSVWGGTWTSGSFRYLKGNVGIGTFYHTTYSMLWSPRYSTYYGSRYTNLAVTLIEGEFGIPAEFRMEPQSLNLESNGNYMNVKVEGFPENPEYSPMDVAHGTLEVEGIGCELKYGTWNDNRYITKVDRLLIEDAIGIPGDDTELKITGYLADGTYFKGIAIIDTHSNA
jgi:hypothetical protein